MRLFLKAVLAQKPWLYDSKTIPMPWRDEIEEEVAIKIKTKKLNIGYYETDGMVSLQTKPPSPETQVSWRWTDLVANA